MHKTKTALAALAVVTLLIITGCTPPATKPTVDIAADKDSVVVSGTVALTATVSPTSATVEWSATGGALNPATGTASTWTAPATVGDYTITAIATEGSLKDTATKTIKVTPTAAVWLHDEVEFDNIDQYIIPNPGDVFSPIRFPEDEWTPAGALVDSVNIVVDIDYGGEPDSFPAMNVWLESPDGSRVLIHNESQSGDPSGEYPSDLFVAFKDKDVNGTWKLLVEAVEANPVPGVIDGFDLDIKFRYQQ